MATISKLPSGKFRAQIRRQGIYKARTFSRKLDAQAWSSELEKSIESGRGVGVMQAPTGMTLADLIEAYLTQVGVTNATDKTLLAFSRVIGGVSIRQLTSFHMQQWVDHRRRQGVSGATIARNLGMISSLLRWAKFIKHIEIDEDLARNARRALAASRISVTGHERDRLPSATEIDRLRKYFREEIRSSLPMEEVMDFAIASAMRVGEICAITFEDVRWDEMSVMIRDRKDPKQKIGNNQVVPLLPDALKIVSGRRERLGGSGRIFPHRSPAISERWFSACKACKIEDLHFHDLRHAAITNLFKYGLGIPEVALISGHRSWRQLKRYTQLGAGDVLARFKVLQGG
jgi:integrase